MTNYETFLASKSRRTSFESCPRDPNFKMDFLFPFQRVLVEWALTKGRCALFEDTGLGKTLQQIAWAQHVMTAGPVLVMAPLAVAQQTVAEAQRFNMHAAYTRRPQDVESGEVRCAVVNYDMLEHFTGIEWAGVVLDESSILKNFTGKTRTQIIEAFDRVPHKLACSATPAPNDFTELGNHAEFFGICKRAEMLAEFFVHDGGSTQDWRLKGHARNAFWKWVCTWAAVLKKPSDIGFSDEGYNLPPLIQHEHVIEIDHVAMREATGEKQAPLFAPEVRTLSDQRATRRLTRSDRVLKAKELCDCEEPVLVWCELNPEADACEEAIPGAVQVKGNDTPSDKARKLIAFANGEIHVLVTKAKIAGMGLNFQRCAKQVQLGVSHSFEQTYQTIRRSYRFGQKRPVHVHTIRAETEGAIVRNYQRKEREAEELSRSMVEAMRDEMRQELRGGERMQMTYEPTKAAELPSWMESRA